MNRAIVIDDKRKEMEAKKRRLQGQASGSNTRPCAYPQQGFQQRNQGSSNQGNRGQYPQRNQFQQRPQYQQQFGNQRPPQQTGNPTTRQGMPNNAAMKSGLPNNSNACYRCGEVGHYAHQCPKKQNQQAP